MAKNDRSHFILNAGCLRRQDNNLYFDRYDEEGRIETTKILPIRGISEIYILAKVDIDTYTMAFLANENVLLHIFSPYQSFRGNFFPSSQIRLTRVGLCFYSRCVHLMMR